MSEPVRFSDLKSLFTAEDGSHTKLVLKPETVKRVAEALELDLHDGDGLHIIITHDHEEEEPEPAQVPVGQAPPQV